MLHVSLKISFLILTVKSSLILFISDKLDVILSLFVSIFEMSFIFLSYPLSFYKILAICKEFSTSLSTDSIFRQYLSTIIYEI